MRSRSASLCNGHQGNSKLDYIGCEGAYGDFAQDVVLHQAQLPGHVPSPDEAADDVLPLALGDQLQGALEALRQIFQRVARHIRSSIASVSSSRRLMRAVTLATHFSMSRHSFSFCFTFFTASLIFSAMSMILPTLPNARSAIFALGLLLLADYTELESISSDKSIGKKNASNKCCDLVS